MGLCYSAHTAHPFLDHGATAPCTPCPRVWDAGATWTAALVCPLTFLTVLWEPMGPVVLKRHKVPIEWTLTCSAARSRAHTHALPSQCQTWGWWSTWRNTCHRRSAHRLDSDAVRQSGTGLVTSAMTTLTAHQPDVVARAMNKSGDRARTSRAERWRTCRKLSFSHHLEERKGIKNKQQKTGAESEETRDPG